MALYTGVSSIQNPRAFNAEWRPDSKVDGDQICLRVEGCPHIGRMRGNGVLFP